MISLIGSNWFLQSKLLSKFLDWLKGSYMRKLEVLNTYKYINRFPYDKWKSSELQNVNINTFII